MNEETLFELLRNTPAAERPALLDEHCKNDLIKRMRLEDLLRADEDTLFHRHDPLGTKSYNQPIGTAGQVVGGRYKLLDSIGEGGMGSVWRAQQSEPVKRLVAVKLIKAGMDSKAVIARFEAERQALAVMDHPNIAKILDGGLHENRPYFVMELVKGVPITEYCDARKLTPKQRLELFLPVCSAIQHAHMKGIIHRDIKPSNVIVALYDDKPIPKVIDFGIAKATGGGLTDASVMTAFGGVVGTPQYMSPEQASLNNLDIDTRSDVYSLGILLYELLAGSPPFARKELEKAGLLEILRVVREEEPLRPSAKLSTADALPTLSANRATEPKQLTGLLRNELDWIVMKSLEKTRERRYESANSFAADVGRYLSGEAVLAHPPSAGYRMRKWVRKNRGLVIASGAVVGALSIGVVGTTFGLLRANAEATRANDEADRANKERDAAERHLVQSYLRPIGYNTSGIDPAEMIALAELSGQDNERIKLLFLEEALADGERALRVARRAERVIQAAVGLSLKRRTAALELCQRKQQDQSADPRVRLCACWMAAELGELDVASLEGHFETLQKERDFSDWGNFVDGLPKKLYPGQEAELAQCLFAFLPKHTLGLASISACNCLARLAPRLEHTTAEMAWVTLIDVFEKTTDEAVHNATGEVLGALATRLKSSNAKKAVEKLIDVFCMTTCNRGNYVAMYAITLLSQHIEISKANTAFERFVVFFIEGLDEDGKKAFRLAFAKVAPHIDVSTGKTSFEKFFTKFSIVLEGHKYRFSDSVRTYAVACRSVFG
jgi:Protein kinase domain